MTVVYPTVRTPATESAPMRLHQFEFRQMSSNPSGDQRIPRSYAISPRRFALFIAACLLALPNLVEAQDQSGNSLFETAFQSDSANAQPGSLAPNGDPIQLPSSNQPLTIPDDVIVDQSFARNGAMFNQLVAPPARTRNFPGWGTTYRIGHQTGRAIGRTESITHIGAMPYVTFDNTMFYGEAQAIRANGPDLFWGGMAGGGVRQYVPELDRIFGGGVFYSRDDISVVDFQQVVFSAETMGEFFDARANIYLPRSTRTGVAAINIIQESARFVDNILEFDRFRDIVTSMKGVDYEIVVPLPGPMGDRLDLRMAAGGYYFDGPEIADVLGWKLRLEATAFDMIDLELQVSDDQTFNTSVMFGASIALGGMPRNDKDGTQFDRMTEWGRRMQHSVVARTRVRDRNLTAINPADSQPYFFYHVASDAAAGGTGTVGDPFQTIVQAQDAIDIGADPVDHVIVHANSLYTTPAVLRSGNSILGQGTDANHVIRVQGFDELLTLPEVRPGSRPILNLTGTVVDGVTLAENSEFSGFIIEHPGLNGIVARNISSPAVSQFNEVRNASLSGILVENSTGTFTFVDNVIQFRDDGTLTTPSTDVQGLHVTGGSPTVVFTSTTLSQDPAPGRLDYRLDNHGSIIRVDGTSGGSLNMVGSTVDDGPSDIALTPLAPGGQGVQITGTPGAPLVTNVSLDNLNIQNSTQQGINIFNTSGRVSILNSIRGASTISGAAGVSVNIQNTQNQVTFSDLSIVGGNDIGINIYDLGSQTGIGVARFTQGVTVGAPTSGTASGINIQRMTPGSLVRFDRDITVDSSGGIGINVGGADVGTDATRAFFPFAPNSAASSIVVGGTTTVSNPAGSGIFVSNDQSDITLTDVTVSGRTGIGLEFVGQPAAATLANLALPLPHGNIAIVGSTNIDNANASVSPAIEIRNSTGQYQFGIPGFAGSTNITGATTGVGGQGAGVNIVDNSDGPNTTILTDDFKVVFNELNITSTLGPGLFIDNDDFYDGNRAVIFPTALFPTAGTNSNAVVRTHSGTFNATTAPAVQAQDSGIDITLGMVNGTGGTQAVLLTDTHFVRLSDINNPDFNFEISGDGITLGSGGIIQTQTGDGVLAQTTLDGTTVLSSANRIDIYDDATRNPAIALRHINFAGATGAVDAVHVTNIQNLVLDSSQVINWGEHGVEILDTISTTISGTFFDDNDVGETNAFSMIQYFASRIPPNSQVYTLDISNNDITDRTFHTIEIATQAPVNTAAGPQLDLFVVNNDRIRVTDNAVIDALNVNWNGVLNATITSNGSSPPATLTEAGFVIGVNSDANNDAGSTAGGINITTTNTTDFATITVQNNFFVANAGQNTAAQFTTAGPSFITASDNRIDFQAVAPTSAIQDGFGTGFLFNMTSTDRDDIIMNSNFISDNSRPRFIGSGVTGAQFQQVTNAFIEINNNLMQRTTIDPPFVAGGITQGIVFSTVNGTVSLFGTQNNQIDGINPFLPVLNPGNFVGTVIINNVTLPQ